MEAVLVLVTLCKLKAVFDIIHKRRASLEKVDG